MEFDINTPVDSLDKVPEQFRPIFADKPGEDGKFTVNPVFKGVADALGGFDRSNKTLRAELKGKTSVDLSPLAEFGDSPADIKAAFDARVAELTAKGGDKAQAIEKVRGEMGAANQAALTAEKGRTSHYQSALHTMVLKNEALSAIASEKGLPDLLMPFIQTQVKVNEVEGKFTVVVLDEKGEPRYSGLTGAPMTVSELVKGMKADPKYGRLFESEVPGGGGMPPGAGRRVPGPNGGGGAADKTPNQKIAAGLAKRFPGHVGRM